MPTNDCPENHGRDAACLVLTGLIFTGLVFTGLVSTGLIFTGVLFPMPAAGATLLPGDDAIEDLRLTREWQLRLDGEALPGLAVYHSKYHVAWLVETPEHGWLLLSPRGSSVQRLRDGALERTGDVSARLEAGAVTGDPWHFETEYLDDRAGAMLFELDGQTACLEPAPPMLGRQALMSVAERHPGFAQKAGEYQFETPLPGPEKNAGEWTVEVYFASWSPICQRIVPKIMAVEQAWAGNGPRFTYHGLPKPLIEDERARELAISGVPTVRLLRDGQEVERLTGRQLDDPAAVLAAALQ